MRKGQIAFVAVLTFGLAYLLLAIVAPIFNRTKSSGDLGRAYGYLLIPVIAQILWFIAGALYSARRKRREVVLGILCGFVLEFAALVVLIVFS